MKNKNSLFILLFLFIAISCRNYSSQKIKKIDFLYVNREIETPFRINEKKFETYFKKDLQYKSISSRKVINDIENELIELETAKRDSFSLPDIRIRMILFYANNTNDTIYMDRFVVQNKTQIYILSSKFKSMINEEINSSL